MGEMEDGAAWGLIDAAGFHAHVAVLDHIDAADAVFAAELVEGLHHGQRAEGFAVEGDAVALMEIEGDVFGLVRSVLWGDAELEHVFVVVGEGVQRRVLEDAGLEGDVEEVAVHGVGFFGGGLDGDVLFGAIGDHLGAARELLAEARVAPGGDDLEVGRQGGGGEFETDLVVAFAGGAMGQGLGLFPAGDFNHALGNKGAGDARAQQILALVNRARLEHREDEVAREFFLQIDDVTLGGAGLPGLGFKALELLLLPNVRTEGDQLRVILFLEPGQDDRGVEAARVS